MALLLLIESLIILKFIYFDLDTHSKHSGIVVPDGDLLLHAGDFTLFARPGQLESFTNWLSALPHSHKFVVFGNHERALRENTKKLSECCHLLAPQASSVMVEVRGMNITVAGLPYFEACDDMSVLQSGLMRSIPQSTDILLTHTPPKASNTNC